MLMSVYTSASTNSIPFWESSIPFGSFDGKHRLDVGKVPNEACRFQSFGIMSYYWDVPADLDPAPSYRFRLRTNDSSVEHFSGKFRLEPGEAGADEGEDGGMRKSWVLGLVLGILLLLLLGGIVVGRLLRWRRRRGHKAASPSYADEEGGGEEGAEDEEGNRLLDRVAQDSQ